MADFVIFANFANSFQNNFSATKIVNFNAIFSGFKVEGYEMTIPAALNLHYVYAARGQPALTPEASSEMVGRMFFRENKLKIRSGKI